MADRIPFTAPPGLGPDVTMAAPDTTPLLTTAPQEDTPVLVTSAPQEGTPVVSTAAVVGSSDEDIFGFWNLFTDTRPFLELLAGGGFPKAYDARKDIPISPEIRSATNEINRLVDIKGGLKGAWVKAGDGVYIKPEANVSFSDGVHSLKKENDFGFDAAISAGFVLGDSGVALIPRVSAFADYITRERPSPAFPEGNGGGGDASLTASWQAEDWLRFALGATGGIHRFNYNESSFAYTGSEIGVPEIEWIKFGDGYGDVSGRAGAIAEVEFSHIPRPVVAIPTTVKLSYQYRHGFDSDLPYLRHSHIERIGTDSDRHDAGVLLGWDNVLLISLGLTAEISDDDRLKDPIIFGVSALLPEVNIAGTNIGDFEIRMSGGDGDNRLYRYEDTAWAVNYRSPAIPAGDGIVRLGFSFRGDAITDNMWYQPADAGDGFVVDTGKEVLVYQEWSGMLCLIVELLPPPAPADSAPQVMQLMEAYPGVSTRDESDRQNYELSVTTAPAVPTI